MIRQCTETCCAHLRAVRHTDLLIAAATIDVHGKPHLKPIADRLANAAGEISAAPVGDATADLAPEPTPSTAEPQEGK